MLKHLLERAMLKLASLIPLSIEGVMQLHRLRNVLGKLRPHPEPAMEVALEITRRLDEQDAHLPAITINPLPTQCLMAQDGIAMLRPLVRVQCKNHDGVLYLFHGELPSPTLNSHMSSNSSTIPKMKVSFYN
jgi:hypothetical protein